MTAASVAVPAAAPLLPARRSAWAMASVGALLAAATVIACIVISTHGGAPSGWLSVAHLLTRMTSGAAILPIGALMFAALPRHPIGQILCVAGLGMLLKSAGLAYATTGAATGNELPLARWAAWTGEWAGAGILLIPTVALLLFRPGICSSATGGRRCGPPSSGSG